MATLKNVATLKESNFDRSTLKYVGAKWYLSGICIIILKQQKNKG